MRGFGAVATVNHSPSLNLGHSTMQLCIVKKLKCNSSLFIGPAPPPSGRREHPAESGIVEALQQVDQRADPGANRIETQQPGIGMRAR